MIGLNDIVTPPGSSRYAVVVGFMEYGGRKLAKLHYIDRKTGNKMECPDHRCNGENNACPIHGRSVDVAELEPWSEVDINYYSAVGMLSPALAHKALAPEIEISHINTYQYRVRMSKNGQNIRLAIVDSERNNELWQEAIILTNDTEYMKTTLTDPDTHEYKNFAALFPAATV